MLYNNIVNIITTRKKKNINALIILTLLNITIVNIITTRKKKNINVLIILLLSNINIVNFIINIIVITTRHENCSGRTADIN